MLSVVFALERLAMSFSDDAVVQKSLDSLCSILLKRQPGSPEEIAMLRGSLTSTFRSIIDHVMIDGQVDEVKLLGVETLSHMIRAELPQSEQVRTIQRHWAEKVQAFQQSRPESGTARNFLTTKQGVESNTSSAWDAVVETLASHAQFDAAQIYQAKRHADSQRRLLRDYSFLNATEFTALLPAYLDQTAHASRTLSRWRDQHRVIAMQVKGDWYYPAFQISPNADLYPELETLIAQATAQEYDAWEIMNWLTNPADLPSAPFVGKPLTLGTDAKTEGEILNAILADVGVDEAETAVPVDLLTSGDTDTFQQLTQRWLGS